jgi:hypothetical protein
MTATPASAVTMTGAQFHRLLTAVLPSAATSNVLPQLNAVHLETGPHGVYAAATDCYTFAVARHADPAPGRRPAQITVPRPAVVAMLRLARRRDHAASVRIAAGYLTLRTAAGITYRTPGIDTRGCSEFPDWRRTFRGLLASPEAPGQPVCLNPAYLARFTAATDTAGLRVSIVRPPNSRRCHTLVITAGDWFLGALMSLASPREATPATGPGGAWHADLHPVRAA